LFYPYVFTRECSEALLRLASENVDLNHGDYDARTPLHLASFGGHIEAVIFLLEQGCDINPVDRWGSTPLNDAKTPEISDILRHNGAKAGVQQKVSEDTSILVQDSIFPLLYAVYGNDLALTQSMLLCGHSSLINNCDYDGRTALGVAASEGHLQMVRYLVTHGADVDHCDVRGNNALADAQREKRCALLYSSCFTAVLSR
jgi:ankyrin repeat protein